MLTRRTLLDLGLATLPGAAEGAAVMGMTLALNSAITYEKGRVQQSNFHDYDVVRTASRSRGADHLE